MVPTPQGPRSYTLAGVVAIAVAAALVVYTNVWAIALPAEYLAPPVKYAPNSDNISVTRADPDPRHVRLIHVPGIRSVTSTRWTPGFRMQGGRAAPMAPSPCAGVACNASWGLGPPDIPASLLVDLDVGSAMSVGGQWSGAPKPPHPLSNASSAASGAAAEAGTADSESRPPLLAPAAGGPPEWQGQACVDPATLSWGSWTSTPRIAQVRRGLPRPPASC